MRVFPVHICIWLGVLACYGHSKTILPTARFNRVMARNCESVRTRYFVKLVWPNLMFAWYCYVDHCLYFWIFSFDLCIDHIWYNVFGI